MGTLLRVGCALVAFAPGAFLALFLLPRRPQLVICALAAAFAWLLAMLIAAILYQGIRGGELWPLMLLMGVLAQEGTRYLFVRAYRRTELIVKDTTPEANNIFPLNDVSSCLAAGLGWALMHSLMMYGSVIFADKGPASHFVDSCPSVPYIVVAAFMSLAFFVMDVLWMALGFAADKANTPMLWALIVGTHVLASYLTLINQVDNGCNVSLPLLYVAAIALAGVAYKCYPLLLTTQRL